MSWKFPSYRLWNDPVRKLEIPQYGYLIITHGELRRSTYCFSPDKESKFFKAKYQFLTVEPIQDDIYMRRCELLYECDTTEQMDEYLNKLILLTELEK